MCVGPMCVRIHIRHKTHTSKCPDKMINFYLDQHSAECTAGMCDGAFVQWNDIFRTGIELHMWEMCILFRVGTQECHVSLYLLVITLKIS